MRTGHLLLVAIALLVVSSDKTTVVKVSARCPDPDSVTLNPGKTCDRQACKMDCANKYHDGVGICLDSKRCYCEYCLDRPSRSRLPPLLRTG
ncbi:hypothetical protein BAE44_0006633 [Dichanthelium oligosanthes]|uniref:Knottin scorpion toxin-like domain-containing protein n=1 Tax=Dichanthelium oligosanthes TaxID=888268 RepID=A0A1E5W516_9POAL|nr:hypothetical protein BAE44_0006633 [Dichanthelium oligosanthes]